MLVFNNDYSVGCHEKVLEKIISTNPEILGVYGDDKYSNSAREKIKELCDCPTAETWFLYGGTQTNQMAIDLFLQPYEGVVSAATGHVAGHEAGAIEFSGHKVLTVPEHLGKIDAKEVDDYLDTFFSDGNKDHMVFPGMVYISHPTEYGTLYTLDELTAISEVCKKYNQKLFVDGARLGYALATPSNDITLKDLARLTDAFYIGGTKCGALCGEALIYPNGFPSHILTRVKQHGALPAKSRLFGVTFDALLTDNLYVDICKNALDCADKIREELPKKGYKFFIDSPTNQIFIIMENTKLKELEDKVLLSFWEKYDDNNTVIRIATSWATTMEDVEKLLEIL